MKPFQAVVLFLLLFIPSLRAIFKFLPVPMLAGPVFGVLLFCFCLFVLRSSMLRKLFGTRSSVLWFIAVVIILYGAVSYIVYPIADARSQAGAGSTGDDAMIATAQQFRSTGRMYDVTLQGGVPVSPGPGWILLNSPFVYGKFFYLLTPFYIAITILAYILMFRRYFPPVLVLLLISSSIIFWELMVTGHDLIALGFAIALVIMMLFHICVERNSPAFSLPVIILALLAGVLSTSRLVFILFPILAGLLLYRSGRGRALLVTFLSLATALLLHTIFYLQSSYYQPLHLLNRGQSHVGMPIIIIGAVATIAALLWIIPRMKNSLESFLGSSFVIMAVPLSFISFGELLNVHGRLADWEGANYLVPVIPMYLFYITCRYFAGTDASVGKIS